MRTHSDVSNNELVSFSLTEGFEMSILYEATQIDDCAAEH
jgi:hypothetical protein